MARSSVDMELSPPEYFEEPIVVTRDDYTMTIADGKAEARIDTVIYDANPSMHKELHEGLEDKFLAEQLITHRPYELSNSATTRVRADGRRDD